MFTGKFQILNTLDCTHTHTHTQTHNEAIDILILCKWSEV